MLSLLRWIFDLSILVLPIWYFSNAQNTSAFWSSCAYYISSAATAVADAAQQIVPHKAVAPAPAANPVQSTRQMETAPPPPVFIPPPLPTDDQLATETPGDCFPPEVRDLGDVPDAAKLFYTPPPVPVEARARRGKGKPVQFCKGKKNGVPYYQVTVDLNDPEHYLVIRLPKNSSEANSTSFSAGHDNFETFVKRYPCAAMVNGTFFSKDDQERVMGNMVSEGKMMKYSQWENYGTTLALREGDYPEMVTARAEGKPQWDEHWFSLTCGPRLLKNGEVWLNPELEGFTDPHVLGAGSRSAIGFPKSRDRLFLITFLRGLTLNEEAKLMKAIGCYEAMNLDGGASKGLYHDGNVVMKPGRGLTNVLVVYDCKHKAPEPVAHAWQQFQVRHPGDNG